ncbi:hypothetical protein [Pelagibius marinus]|uniref:hypothetical protein n=1 Tax=Pelagibius marinus TaxID=2762760 RepID=UPI0018733B36|nr:hypothetical protein [Pelagibius marinus]
MQGLLAPRLESLDAVTESLVRCQDSVLQRIVHAADATVGLVQLLLKLLKLALGSVLARGLSLKKLFKQFCDAFAGEDLIGQGLHDQRI